MSKEKGIKFQIVIPVDGSVSGKTILEEQNLRVRHGGFCGEKLIFWLIAVWEEQASYLGKTDWNSNNFKAEITNLEVENVRNHISTTEIKHLEIEHKTELQALQVAVPLTVILPNAPHKTAQLSVWKGDFTTKIVSIPIEVSLPIRFQSSFSVVDDNISVLFDFANSQTDINSHVLNFIPRPKVSLTDYESALAIKKVSDNQYYISLTSNKSILLLKNLQLSFMVHWNKNTMLSTFSIDVPIPPSNLSLLWNCPPLSHLHQTSLFCEITNMGNSAATVSIELDEDIVIPLKKFINIGTLQASEHTLVEIPVVPIKKGYHTLHYQIKVGNSMYKPLFQTIIQII